MSVECKSIKELYLDKDPLSEPPDYDLEWAQEQLSKDKEYEQWLKILESNHDF